MASIFTKIINREIPGYIVAEDDQTIAFLDINPIAQGHTLVVPKQEVDYVFDLDDATLAHVHVFAKKLAKAIETVVPCNRIGLAVVGLEVPHAHVHLVPLNTMADIDFNKPKLTLSKETFETLHKQIAEAFTNQ